MYNLLMMILGLLLLFVGGESLIKGSVSLARNFGLSRLLVSTVIIGFGTSMPEMSVSVEAAFIGSSGIAVGNIVGSNIANILLIIGLSAILLPLLIDKNAVKRDVFAMLVACIFLCILGFIGRISFISGFIMLLALIVYIIWSYNQDRINVEETIQHIEKDIEGAPLLSASRAAFLCLLGLILLISGAYILVDSAVVIARDFGISEAVIGLTIVAVGTSLPELVTSIVAACRKHYDVIIGNIVGSNIFNILGILGISSMITPIPIAKQIVYFDNLVMLLVTVFLSVYLLKGLVLGRIIGFIMVIAYVLYTILLYMNTMTF